MPEVLTPQQAQASNAELCRDAQEHYDKLATAAHEWHSAIPKAIDAYYADPERTRLERLVIEAAKAWNSTNHRDMLKCEETLTRLGDAVDALETFESQQTKK